MQMAADIKASMFSMFIMFNMHVWACMCACACMCLCVCLGYPSTHPYPSPPPSTHLPPPGGGPPESVKFNNTWTNQDISTKCKIWIKCPFSHTTVNHRKNFNALLDTLICPLQIINDIEPLSLTLHGVNACFIHHPSNVGNYLIGHKSETGQPKKKKKVGQENIFLYLYTGFGVKIQNTHRYRNSATFLTSWQWALNGPANGSEVTYSKIQNRLRRAP